MPPFRNILIFTASIAISSITIPSAAHAQACVNQSEYLKLPASERRLRAQFAALNDEYISFCSTSIFPKSSDKDYAYIPVKRTSFHSSEDKYPQDNFTPYSDREDFPDQESYDAYKSRTNARTAVIINGMRY